MRRIASVAAILAGAFACVCGQTEPAATAPDSRVQEYVLQPGDVIGINVVEHPEFSGQHKIRPDGRINYPVIGELDVATLTCAQLVKIMQGKLSAYINNPAVSISIEAYFANKIFVIGGVARAGEYQIYEPIDALKAIAMCGGLARAKTRHMKIIRADGSVIRVDMRDFWGTDTHRDNSRYVLYPGDALFVPAPFEMPWSLITTLLGIVQVSLIIIIYSNQVGHL
jgi:polysaccharide biosynthesis/export protein